jgi:hypothetical protein
VSQHQKAENGLQQVAALHERKNMEDFPEFREQSGIPRTRDSFHGSSGFLDEGTLDDGTGLHFPLAKCSLKA